MVFSTFWISKMVCLKRALHQKERNVDIRYHTESQGLRIQRVLYTQNVLVDAS